MPFHMRTSKYRHVFCDPPKPEVSNAGSLSSSSLSFFFVVVVVVAAPRRHATGQRGSEHFARFSATAVIANHGLCVCGQWALHIPPPSVSQTQTE